MNLASSICALGALILAYSELQTWGWFLAASVIIALIPLKIKL